MESHHMTAWKLSCHSQKTWLLAQDLLPFYLASVCSVELTHIVPRWFDLEHQFWKLWPCLFFVTDHNFRDELTFAALIRLWAAITMAKIIRTPKCHTYSESWVRALSHGPILVEFFFTKFSRRSERSKKCTFLQFSVSAPPEQSNGPPFGQYWRQRASR